MERKYLGGFLLIGFLFIFVFTYPVLAADQTGDIYKYIENVDQLTKIEKITLKKTIPDKFKDFPRESLNKIISYLSENEMSLEKVVNTLRAIFDFQSYEITKKEINTLIEYGKTSQEGLKLTEAIRQIENFAKDATPEEVQKYASDIIDILRAKLKK